MAYHVKEHIRMASRIKDILSSPPGDQSITAEGWCKTKRDSKSVAFFELTDGSSFRSLQVVVDKGNEETDRELERLATGASVRAEGRLVASPGKDQSVELHADTVQVIGEASPENYPLQKKRHSFEFLREIAHLRPRTNTFGAVARVRNDLSFAIHKFFQEHDFLYVHTPIISTSDCEGAGEMFQVTTIPLETLARKNSAEVDYTQDFFGQPASLTVSGQLEAEIYALAMRDVYTFGPTFRAENSNTSRHLAEFWMIEPEMAFCTLDGDMELAEEFIKYILRYVLENRREDMEFFNKWIQKGIIESLEQVVESTFTHLPYDRAVELLQQAGRDFEYPVQWGSDLQSEHERYLTEEVFKGPVIVTDYPKEIKAFYMKLNEDGRTVRAMDILVPRLGEIIGGSEREDRYDVLKNRIEEMGLNAEDYWWYLDLRRYGSVPHSGFGLGFERLVQYVTGMQNIRDVIPFPRTVGSAGF
jgi:asparaginyl-tRNA synthetase